VLGDYATRTREEANNRRNDSGLHVGIKGEEPVQQLDLRLKPVRRRLTVGASAAGDPFARSNVCQ
jgi:hypothetical protein